jgi:hypothetical protein
VPVEAFHGKSSVSTGEEPGMVILNVPSEIGALEAVPPSGGNSIVPAFAPATEYAVAEFAARSFFTTTVYLYEVMRSRSA